MSNIVVWVGSDALGENEAGCGKRCPKEPVLSGKFSVGIAEGTETDQQVGKVSTLSFPLRVLKRCTGLRRGADR